MPPRERRQALVAAELTDRVGDRTLRQTTRAATGIGYRQHVAEVLLVSACGLGRGQVPGVLVMPVVIRHAPAAGSRGQTTGEDGRGNGNEHTDLERIHASESMPSSLKTSEGETASG